MMENSQILVVDDDQQLLNALKSALSIRMENLSVETVESGAEALDILRTSVFDVVISDIKMPGMDGLTLLNEIRKLDPDLPTMLITGHGQHDLAVQALRGGAFDFIQKPLDRDYLVAALRRAIRVRKQHETIVSQRVQLEKHAAELETKVQDRTRKLRELNRAKDQFLAMLAHELRNPLACIRHSIDLLDSSDAPIDTQTELFESMTRQVSHMTHLLDDLLDVSRISRNEIKIRKTPVDLSHLIKAAIAAMRPLLSEWQHTLEADLPEVPIIVDGDPSRLEQIVVNLLHNAAKYTDPPGKIRIALKFDTDHAIVEIEDNGIGISPTMLRRIFELFSQADHSLDRARGGLGIGLTLAQRLAQLHGGIVQVHSAGEGLGSTFTLFLPARQAASERIPETPKQRPQMQRHRVILVEDNQTLAKLTCNLLQDCGQEVVAVVSDGISAVDVIRAHKPEFVFLDIGIPKIDGFEVARRVRQIDELADLTLVALTGYGRDEDRRRSAEVGFDHHLTKPVSVDVLEELFSNARSDHVNDRHVIEAVENVRWEGTG